MLPRVVFALQNSSLQKSLEENLAHANAQIECCEDITKAWQYVVQSCADIIVISQSLIPPPFESGISVLNNLPEAPTIVLIHDFDSSEEHAKLMAAGADVVLYSGVTLKNLIETIETTLESRLQLVKLDLKDRKKNNAPKLGDFISNSDIMQMFIHQVQLVAPSESIILLLGETGVGKEHLAKAIHAESPRASGPFIALNTAALPDQLLESELFGHTKGSFTGATRSRRGAFELAHGGTIFLDEIGEMPLHLQAKLLRVLQDYEVKPLGGEKPIWVDVRVMAATNRDLEEEVAAGHFRKDLFYRLNVMSLTIPPLRMRKEDIPSLTRRFIAYYKHKVARNVSQISDSAMSALCEYDWPGNVRELMNVIERAMLLCKGDRIVDEDLPSLLIKADNSGEGIMATLSNNLSAWEGKTLPEVQREVMEQVDTLYLNMILRKTSGRIGEAARLSGIHSRGFYSKMKRLGIKKETFKKP